MEFYNKKLKEIRKGLRLNQTEFADILGVNSKTLWAWEIGKIIPNEKKLKNVAKLLNIPISSFTSIEEDSKSFDNDKLRNDLKSSWFSLLDNDEEKIKNNLNRLINDFQYSNNKLTLSTIIIKALMSSLDIGLYIKDSSNKFIIANSAFYKLFNLHSEFNITNKTDLNIFSKQKAENNRIEDEGILNNSIKINGIEQKLTARSNRWVKVSKYPIYDKRNKNIGLIGIFIDITEEKNAVFIKDLLEQAISSSENLAIIYEKRTSKKLYISGNIKEILGFTKEEYVQTGKDIWLEKLCKEPQLSDISANSNYKSTTVYEQMHVCKDKTVKWLEANCSQINYCGKECILVILRDITSRHENDRLKKLLKINIDNMAEAISIVTLKDNRNLYLNDACCTLTGYSKEVFLNKNGYEFWLNNILHPDFKKQYIDNRNIKKSIKQEYKIIRAGGEEKWVQNSMSTIFFENEESHLSVEIDISNQK